MKKPLNTIPEAKNNRPDSTRIALQQFTGWQKRSKKKKKRWGKGWGVKIIPITPSHNKRSQVSREKKKNWHHYVYTAAIYNPRRKAIKTVSSRQHTRSIARGGCLQADRQDRKYRNIVSFPRVIYSNVHNGQVFFFLSAGGNALSRFAFYTLQCPKNSRLVGGRMSVTTFFSPSPYRGGEREGGRGSQSPRSLPKSLTCRHRAYWASIGTPLPPLRDSRHSNDKIYNVGARLFFFFFEVPAAETTMCALQSSKFPNYTQHTRKTTTAASPQRGKP